jgi:hypothetical protein
MSMKKGDIFDLLKFSYHFFKSIRTILTRNVVMKHRKRERKSGLEKGSGAT